MIKSLRIVKKRGRVICCNCGRGVQSGTAYVRIGRKNYCVMCEGPGKETREAPK
jgi:late competence protein required for DNA uptake (superfamily II DNA/RNA helicase)